MAVKFIETLLTYSHILEELLVRYWTEVVGALSTEYTTTTPEREERTGDKHFDT